jgi:hypothetical protein
MFSGMRPSGVSPEVYRQVDAIWPYFDYKRYPGVKFTPETVGDVGPADLERAKLALTRFTVVLSLDWLEECAPLLKRWFRIEVDDIRARHWHGAIITPPKGGKGLKRRHMDPRGEYKALFDLNQYDMELYEHARTLCRCGAQATYFRAEHHERGEERAGAGVAPRTRERECLHAHKMPSADDDVC